MMNRTKITGRRSVITLPLVGPKNNIVNNVIERAVIDNIVVVASAGEVD